MGLVIPDIALRNPGTFINGAGSQPVSQGYASDQTYGWDAAGILDIFCFDLWENGSPLVDGRTFQLTCFVTLTGGGTPGGEVYNADGPNHLLPIVRRSVGTPFVLGNMPITYLRNSPDATGLSTCFYYDPSGSGTACFFDGAFYAGSPTPGLPFTYPTNNGVIPNYQIPLIVDAAQVAGTPIDGYDSSLYSWCMAGTQFFPCPIMSGTALANIGTPPFTAVDARPFVNKQYVAVGGATSFQRPIIAEQFGNPANARSFGAQDGHGCVGDLATHRRGSTSATYVWPGWQVTP